ncbi:C40 family peptidase [Renibacterium salmoninarum]|uniref:C40 family peptidase n=1 Tax=Renibacterium salmoninarum TaxID=1646 RepID=UPI0002EC4D0E|nr:NlpC/P60 family protein [Renibacterium salmoninarum]
MQGKALSGWGGGAIPYSWGGGRGSKPGPSLGTCSGYTGSIKPCPADSTKGLDCSGFSRWIYSLAGGSDLLGAGNTDNQLAKMKKTSSPKPGDLAFFGKLSDTHHVGIYLGNDKMANAPYTGVNVRIGTVSSHSDLVGYYTLGK